MSAPCEEKPSHLKELFQKWRGAPPSRAAMAVALERTDAAAAAQVMPQWEASKLADVVDWPVAQHVHIALAGYSSLQYLQPFVASAALADGFVPRLTLGGYNQLIQDLAQPLSPVTAGDVDLLWIWAGIEDLLPREFAARPARLASAAGLEAVDQGLALLEGLLKQCRERTPAVFLVNDFVALRRSPLGIADSRLRESFSALYRHANARLQEVVQGISSTYIYTLNDQLLQFGLERAVDPRLGLLADCLYVPEFFFRVSQGLRPYLRALRGAARKVLVLDLDNTVWGGVVGEVGADGIRIGSDPAGKAYVQFQAAILELYDRGVILAINSKNNLDDVKEVFEKRSEMLLRPEHFASMMINWQDKAGNCCRIAQEINVGLDSLVFWDDNPAERAAVRHFTPDVYVVEPPRDVSRWAETLGRLDLFDALTFAEEDAQRGRMYAEDRQRRAARETAFDLASFLQGLELKVTCAPACSESNPRIASLLSRTNQFNLTTRRHSEEIIRRWSADPTCSIMTYSAEDRFGCYGIVGVTILSRQSDAAFVDSLLLSCRAIGKGIEEVMLAAMDRQARAWGLRRLDAVYIPTRKNAPVRTFLPNHGFAETQVQDGAIGYSLNLLERALPMPRHVKVEISESF